MGVTSRWIFGLEGYDSIRSNGQATTTQDHSRLGVRLRILLLSAFHLSTDDVFPHVVLLAKVEEFPYLGCPLRPKTLGQDIVCEAWELVVALLDNDKGEDGNIWADNAATHGLAPALTVAAGAVARVAVGKKETDTVWEEDTLFHGKALLVVSTGDAEDVALEFVAKVISLHLLSDFLVIEDTAVEGSKCQYEE